MEVNVIRECGLEEALLGLSLSYGRDPNIKVAQRLAFRQGGHNKFLESIVVWLDVKAPRYWWSQYDTYRVGTTKQSESTMHTILLRPLSPEDFEGGIDIDILEKLNAAIVRRDFPWVKRHLPESFLQRRIVCTNYKVLQNICLQRQRHKLEEWPFFIQAIRKQVERPELIYAMHRV
jgi:hypothetical protein